MGKVYLIDLQTQEVKETFENVIMWGSNFVEYDNNGRCKKYCDETQEYFTDEVEDEAAPEEPEENFTSANVN